MARATATPKLHAATLLWVARDLSKRAEELRLVAASPGQDFEYARTLFARALELSIAARRMRAKAGARGAAKRRSAPSTAQLGEGR
jgi:N-glycosylase/DNA lyase